MLNSISGDLMICSGLEYMLVLRKWQALSSSPLCTGGAFPAHQLRTVPFNKPPGPCQQHTMNVWERKCHWFARSGKRFQVQLWLFVFFNWTNAKFFSMLGSAWQLSIGSSHPLHQQLRPWRGKSSGACPGPAAGYTASGGPRLPAGSWVPCSVPHGA